MVGYCSPQTAGGILKAGASELKVMGDTLEVKASIKSMDSFSAHGDRIEMLNSISHLKKGLKKVFLVHGEYDTQQAFAEYLGQGGIKKVSIPSEGEEIHI